MRDQLTIGQVAKRSGVNFQTVRFYEKARIVLPLGRRDSGYRFYGEDAVKKIQFIKNAQALGFTLKEIKGLLKLRVRKKVQCNQVKSKAQTKLNQVQEKISSLRSLEKALKSLVKACCDQKTTDHCPVLQTLEIEDSEKRPAALSSHHLSLKGGKQ